METIDQFRKIAHSDGFKVEHCWLQLSDQRSEVNDFLEIAQKGSKPKDGRLTRYDLEAAVNAYRKTVEKPDGFIHKIAVQKCNAAIFSRSSGCWTHLAFLYGRVEANEIQWFVFAYGRGRFKPLFLAPEDRSRTDIVLGYTSFLSVNERSTVNSKELDT